MPAVKAFGAYIPGNSVLHTMNAQVKIILTCVFSIGVFFVDTWLGIALLSLLVAAGFAMSRIPVSKALGGLSAVSFILLFTLIAHAFTADVATSASFGQAGSIGSSASIALWGTFGVSLDGCLVGCFLVFRIALLILLCSLMTFTSSMTELTNAIGRLLAPLGKLGVPVADVSTVISIAFRFIPLVSTEAYDVKNAQESRGAKFGEGGPIARVKAWGLVLVPLFVRLFKRADELSAALDARKYGSHARGALNVSKLCAFDVAALLLGSVVMIGIAVLL